MDVVIGRSKKDIEKHGTKAAIFLGRQYVRMGQTVSLSNNLYLDVAGSHVYLIAGKRGSGKSYTMGVIAEGISNLGSEVKDNISVIMLDTMGVYWTMKYPNHVDAALLKDWNLDPKALDVKIFTPAGFYDQFLEEGIPTDAPFAIEPSDLNADDWCKIFSITPNSEEGVLLSNVLYQLSGKISIGDIIKRLNEEQTHLKDLLINHFTRASNWGIFDIDGTPLSELSKGGQITVLDMSMYATLPSGWLIKNMVVGLIGKKMFNQRMIARKNEEFASVDSAMHYFKRELSTQLKQPLVWLVLDEAHEMLPHDGVTAATESLITILREGRQPGISLILATQQPGKIHTDVMTQADTVIAHRITAQIDTQALGALMQSYMREGLAQQLDRLPRVKGSALIFDDTNERLFQVQIRPRITWHGGGSPSALREKIERI